MRLNNKHGSRLVVYVIGVAGQAQMGKDTLADELQILLNQADQCVNWTRFAFATSVKRVFMETFGVDAEFVEKWKVRPEIPEGFSMPVRQSLQFIGDGFRQIQSNIWLDLAFREKVAKIISDVRYVNEFRRVKKEGGLNILVGRPEKLNSDPNRSESEIRPYIVWCFNAFPESSGVIDLRSVDFESYRRYPADHKLHPPKFMEDFHFFVRNEKQNKEEFYHLIKRDLLNPVRSFKFSPE